MAETNWDTDETSRIIANDEGLYNATQRLVSIAFVRGGLAQLMEEEFSDIIETDPYSEIDINRIEWNEIASEYIEEE